MTLFLARTETEKKKNKEKEKEKSLFDTAVAQEVVDESKKGIEAVF